MADKDATLKINVANYKMKVTANYTPASGEGNGLIPEDVLSQLESMNITTGIKHDIIQRMCESDRPMNAVVISEAIKPQVGEKARIETFIELNKFGKAKKKEDGSVDFYDLGEVSSATAGQELFHKIPPTVGEPGKDVLGNEIPGILGKDMKLILGKGTAFDDNDPNLVRATTDGKVVVKKGIMEIQEIHSVKGDVDFSSGNILFKGAVKIGGTVKSGFKVVADGDVEIGGNVEDAEVIGGNDVIIRGGYAGSGEGIVKATRDISVKFIENQHLEAGRDIIINGESYHATLLAGRSIFTNGSKGKIVGGQCVAKTSVESNSFGSVACTPTVIKIGIDPKIAEKLKTIEEEIKKTEESYEKIEKSVLFLYKLKIDLKGKLPHEKKELLEKLEQAKKSIPEILESLQKEHKSLLKEQKDLSNVFATADKGVYPKVRVYIGNQWITIDDNLGPSRFKLVGSEVVRTSK